MMKMIIMIMMIMMMMTMMLIMMMIVMIFYQLLARLPGSALHPRRSSSFLDSRVRLGGMMMIMKGMIL